MLDLKSLQEFRQRLEWWDENFMVHVSVYVPFAYLKHYILFSTEPYRVSHVSL